MKTEELTALGLSEEQTKSVLTINEKDIEKLRTQAETYKIELGGVKELISERDRDIEELKKLDAQGLKSQLDSLQSKYQTDTEELTVKLKNQVLESKIDLALTGVKARNATAVKALLKREKIALEGENVTGLTEQLETITKENPYLFGEVDKNPLPGGGSHTSMYTREEIARMSPEEINKNWDNVKNAL